MTTPELGPSVTAPAAPVTGSHKALSCIGRLGAAVLGIGVLLVSAVVTLGSSLGALIGVWFVGRVVKRRGGKLSHGASWISAAVSSAITFAVVIAVLVALAPPHARHELGAAIRSRPSTAQVTLPPWLARVLPQAGQPTPAVAVMVHSSTFTLFITVIASLTSLGFVGAIAGTFGWVGAFLLGYAFRRTRAV
jgi:hypothetical protein